MVEMGEKAAIEEPESKAKFMLYLVTDSLIQAPNSGWTTARIWEGVRQTWVEGKQKTNRHSMTGTQN